jgi:hypothetical protein
MEVNATVIGYAVVIYMVFSLCLAVLSYFLLKNNRKAPSSDALMVLLLMLVPPLSLIALFIFYLKPNKQ